MNTTDATKSFWSMFIRWAIACLPFVIVTIISAGFGALRYYALPLLSVGAIYLAAFYFIKSGRKIAMIMIPLVALIMGYALQEALISLGANLTNDAYMILAQCWVITVALIKSKPRETSTETTARKYFKREDSLLVILMGAILSGVFFLLLEFVDIVVDDFANLSMYGSYAADEFFLALDAVSLLGYVGCLLAIIIYYSAPFIAQAFKWWFDLDKKLPAQNS